MSNIDRAILLLLFFHITYKHNYPLNRAAVLVTTLNFHVTYKV